MDEGTGDVGNCSPGNTSSKLDSDNLEETNPTLWTAQRETSAKNKFTLLLQAAENQDGWDKVGNLKRNQKAKGNPYGQYERMMFHCTQDSKKDKMEECSIVGQTQK
nr:hypothetical protein CFP56_05365 [Quercus suber]